ncbi:MAG: START domain-containing protein [Spongiibacteraceae bacterium]
MTLRSALRSFCVLILLTSGAAGWAEEWRLERDRHGIKVYSRAVEGSMFRAVRGVATVDGTMARLVTLLKDPTLRSRWDQFCGESYVFETRSNAEQLVYVHSKLPWPVTDRDMLNRVQWGQGSDSGTVTMQSVATRNILPAKSGRVRVVEGWNDWQLRSLPNGKVEIITSAHLDPAGPLPSWLLNSLSVESPYDMLRRLSTLAGDKSIAEAVIDFPKSSAR